MCFEARVVWCAWCVLALLVLLDATDPAARPVARPCCDAVTSPPPPSSATPGPLPSPDGRESDDGVEASDALRFSDAFFQCYDGARQRDSAAASSSTLSCVGEGARVGLESFFTRRDVHVSEGLTLVQEGPTTGRQVPDEALPPLFDGYQRSVIDSAAAYLSARSLRWDMSGLYPGLVMRVGPTLSGNGWLEFVLEPRKFYSDRQLGPSRAVLKQVVLPFLLGLKVSVASLVPLLLFAIVFLAKKALLMSQLSALVSGLLGFGAYAPYGHPHAFGGLDGGGPGLGPGVGSPLFPVRSPQIFPSQPQRQPIPVEEHGPHILHVGSNTLLSGTSPGTPAGLSPSWLTGTPQHLFRKVNYDFRDERHAGGAAASSSLSTATSSTRNTKGFRWEDEIRAADRDPRAMPEEDARHSNVVWGTLSLG